MSTPKRLRYTVDGTDKTYASAGEAVSCSISQASKRTTEGTWYARDLDGTIVGYSERDALGVITTTRRA